MVLFFLVYYSKFRLLFVAFSLFFSADIFFLVAKQAPVPDLERPNQIPEPDLGLLDVALVGHLTRGGRGRDLQGDIVTDHDIGLLVGQAHDHHHDLDQVTSVLSRGGLELALTLIELCDALLAQEEVDFGVGTRRKKKKIENQRGQKDKKSELV